jgi:predicted RNA-binding protein with PIN domain
MKRRPPCSSHPERFRWIVDGHNVIFAVPEWEGLQIRGRRREARVSLEASFEAFGRAVGRQVWVVYDGNDQLRNPDARERPFLRTIYSHPPEEADDRILSLARQLERSGEKPMVVSSDRSTLVARLGRGIGSIDVHEFFREVYGPLLRTPEKWVPEGLDDIEEHFLRSSPYEEDRRSAEKRPGPDPEGPVEEGS